jgi:hypothetical protein
VRGIWNVKGVDGGGNGVDWETKKGKKEGRMEASKQASKDG